MKLLLAFLCLSAITCFGQRDESNATDPAVRVKQNAIIEKYLKQGAWKHSYFLPQWGANIDAGLKEDSTIAYLWQQRAMPLFKQRKYDLGMEYLDKAVRYNAEWLDYRAFIKCIFAKTYRSALVDFQEAVKRHGNNYVMDHSYHFYMALCYLQLNEYDKALTLLKGGIDKLDREKGADWAHHLSLFYQGIAYYELQRYDEAIASFDRALLKYKDFSDVKYFKGKCFLLQGKEAAGLALMREAKADYKKGFTINEDNSFYEEYPYQVNWKLVQLKD
jgi:tetratricopeptide (TPR) repeat protein